MESTTLFDYDNSYDKIEHGNRSVKINDVGLDSEIESFVDFYQEKYFINYKNEMIHLQRDVSGSFIEVDGNRIPIKRSPIDRYEAIVQDVSLEEVDQAEDSGRE